MPDLLEEKLRSQLEEEKRRWPLFFLHTPGPQPQRALGTTRSFLVIAGWSGPYPGLQLLWEVGLKIVGGGAACEQEDVKGRKLRQGEGGMGSRRPSRPLEPGSVTQAELVAASPARGPHCSSGGSWNCLLLPPRGAQRYHHGGHLTVASPHFPLGAPYLQGSLSARLLRTSEPPAAI